MDSELLFEKGKYIFNNSRGEKIEARYYIPKYQKIVNSSDLFTVLESNYPEIDSYKNMFQTFIQAHQFNEGIFYQEYGRGNVAEKNTRKVDPKSLNPENLRKAGIEQNYFNGQRFSEEEIEKLFSIFKPDSHEDVIIDQIIYEELPPFFISKNGYIKYLARTFNLVYDCWEKRKIKSYDDLKKEIVGQNILHPEEQTVLSKLKKDFIELLGITNNVYTIDNGQTVGKDQKIDEIKSDLEITINNFLKNKRKGKKKEHYSNFINLLNDFSKGSTNEKVEILSKIFDDIVDKGTIYIYLARKLAKFYALVIGNFCRRELPRLAEREKMNREEIRLFILMNIPLKLLNYHRSYEKRITDFLRYKDYLDQLFNLLISRNRTKKTLGDLETSFKSYLKYYRILITIIRDYEREKKRRKRSKEYNIVGGIGISNNDYEERLKNYSRKTKKVLDTEQQKQEDEDDLEEDVVDEQTEENDEEILDYENDDDYGISDSDEDKNKNDDVLKSDAIDAEDEEDEDETTARGRSKNIPNPNRRENAIRKIELDNFLDNMGFEKTDRQIIEYKMLKLNEKEIGEMFNPKKSKQAVNKRWKNIVEKFPSESRLYEEIMD